MLYLVGAGISVSLTLEGVEACKRCSEVYLDRYTVLLEGAKERLEEQLGREVVEVERNFLESDEPLRLASNKDIAVVCVGDPFFATTHITLYAEARKRGIGVKAIHNSSIINVVGRTGLSPYKFGAVVTVPRWLPNYRPTSSLDRIENNLKAGLHTLVLADISNGENMSIGEFIETVRKMEEEKGKRMFGKVVGISRAGLDGEKILYGELEEMRGRLEPPFSVIVPAALSAYEEEILSILY